MTRAAGKTSKTIDLKKWELCISDCIDIIGENIYCGRLRDKVRSRYVVESRPNLVFSVKVGTHWKVTMPRIRKWIEDDNDKRNHSSEDSPEEGGEESS